MSKQLVYNAESCDYEPLNSQAEDNTRARTKQESTKVKLYEYLMFGITSRGYITSSLVLNTDLIELIANFARGTQKDIDFLSKTIVNSREKWNVKNSVSIMALVILSASNKAYAKDKFKKIFKDVIKTEDDLIEFMEFINTDSIRGFGKIIQNAISDWFDNLSPYEALKIKNKNRQSRHNASGTTYTVADILRLCHVKPKTDEQSALYKWIMTGELKEDLHQSIRAAEWYQKQTTLAPQKREITQNNNIPIEILQKVKSPTDAYVNVFHQLSFDDLMSNFTFLAEKGVFYNDDVKKRLEKILGNKTTIKKSGILPYQLLELYDQNTNQVFDVLALLEKAAENSLVNLPVIDKKISIFVDSSANALDMFASQSTKVPMHFTFSTLAAIISKIAKNTDIYTFNSTTEKKRIDNKKNILRISDQIVDDSRKRDLDYVQLFKYLVENNVDSDIFIFLSTGGRWEEHLRHSEAGVYYQSFVNSKNEQKRYIFLNANDRTEQLSHDLPKTDFIHGWHDRNLKYLLYLLQIDTTKIDRII